jgi:hypothetical protein
MRDRQPLGLRKSVLEVRAPKPCTQWAFLAIIASLLMGTNAASAHHSAAMYDASKTVTLHGTLQRTQLSNPHSWFWLVVPNGENSGEVWALEGGGVAELIRRWGPDAKNDLTIGQKITITIHPLKDGRLSGQIVSIILEDGKVLSEPTAGTAPGAPTYPSPSQASPSPQ